MLLLGHGGQMAAAANGDYLEGIVGAMSRVGTLIVTMGLISGLILVVLYIENFSINDNLYLVAQSVREDMRREASAATDRIKAIDVHYSRKKPEDGKLLSDLRLYCEDKRPFEPVKCREVLFVEVQQVFHIKDDFQDSQLLVAIAPACRGLDDLAACRQQLIDERSKIELRTRRIDNELQFVNLGRVKLPFLGYELSANDAPVVLGFFLVIFASVTLITVHHLNRVFEDKEILAQVRKNLVLLRARLVLIYAPTNGGFISFLTMATFFLPCFVMAIAAFNVARHFWNPAALMRQHVYHDAIVQCIILFLITIFLSYLAIFLVRGWLRIGAALGAGKTE
jgi:hypothetical protein